MSQDLSVKNLVPQLKDAGQQIVKYGGLLFFMLVSSIYAFVLFQINNMSNVLPNYEDAKNSGVTTTTLNVNKDTAAQLEQLKDNSVNVQALFDNARNNPFEE